MLQSQSPFRQMVLGDGTTLTAARSLASCFILLAFLLDTPAAHAGILIDFETLSDGITTPTYLQRAASEYASLGVTFAGGGTAGQPMFRPYNSLDSGIASWPTNNDWFITTLDRTGGGEYFDLDIFFSNPVSAASGDVLENPGYSVTATAYDAAGNVVATSWIPGGSSEWIAGSFHFASSGGIARINLQPVNNVTGPGLDNLVISGGRVAVDIKPGSCPNRVNIKDKGVLPVAILGAADFDVTTIDPASIRLAGIAPIRWALEDVATAAPVGSAECVCASDKPDGFLDLTLKFDVQHVVAALGEVRDGETVPVTLTAMLREQHGGCLVEGSDCVVILNQEESRGRPYRVPVNYKKTLPEPKFSPPLNPATFRPSAVCCFAA